MRINADKLLDLLRFLAAHRPDFGSLVVAAIVGLVALHVAGVMDGSPSIARPPQTPRTENSKPVKPQEGCSVMPDGTPICNPPEQVLR